MQKAERELIEEKFKGVYLHQNTNFDSISDKLELIYKQTLLTNSRVSSFEKQTKVTRFLETHPKIALLIALGMFSLVIIFDLKDLINLFK